MQTTTPWCKWPRPASEEAHAGVLHSTNYETSLPGLRDHTTESAQPAIEEAVTADVRRLSRLNGLLTLRDREGVVGSL